MSADEARDQNPAAPARVRTGPRHAAPRKPLFTRFQMPAGKAIAMAAMPTAVLMGMGFTPTLALADSNTSTTPPSNSLTADEYKDCVAALDAEKGKDATPAPSPSASDDAAAGKDKGTSASGADDKGDKAEPAPEPSAPQSGSDAGHAGDKSTPSPSPSESGGNLLEDIGDALGGIFTGGKSAQTPTPTPTPTPSTSSSPEKPEDAAKDASGTVKDTAEKATGTVKDTAEKATGAAKDTAEKAAEGAAGKDGDAAASPSPSGSPADPEDCPAATDDKGGIDNKILVPDDPWYLQASSLTLKGADYQGVVEVKTANGSTKKVLKYVISDGTDIGDLHQLVKDKRSGKTYHVQAAKGSTSTIRDGKTVMYTESISGNLLGLIPVTFDPEHPPPLNIPFIYFTNVKVTQAGQFGGTLTVPGMQQYVT
ncbi:hypothetical protein [Streptomyces sp. TRM68367]|uniref:hypothetical protein n=1 Tax=Streptomyces sp. TRM68367 TaxID=2758415 RepID=UPI0037DD4273